MSGQPTSRDILRWFPQKWSEVAGNTQVIQTWWEFLTFGLCCTLFTGPSRTGKTRTIMLGIKALLCQDRTAELNPCGKCENCKTLGQERHAHTGCFAHLNESRYQFTVIDCERVAREQLLGLHSEVNLDDPNTIIYLDEVAALGRRGLESLLWKPLDESQAVWLASAVNVRRKKKDREKKSNPNRLSFPMQSRFGVRVGTTFPSEAELQQWILDRCREWCLKIIEEDTSVRLIMQRTKRRVGFVIQYLAAAAARGRIIDPAWVEKYNLGPLD